MRKIFAIVALLSIGLTAGHLLLGAGDIVFQDAARQSEQFIGWYRTIKLTPEQERVRDMNVGTGRFSYVGVLI
jgi:hypothetical protein